MTVAALFYALLLLERFSRVILAKHFHLWLIGLTTDSEWLMLSPTYISFAWLNVFRAGCAVLRISVGPHFRCTKFLQWKPVEGPSPVLSFFQPLTSWHWLWIFLGLLRGSSIMFKSQALHLYSDMICELRHMLIICSAFCIFSSLPDPTKSIFFLGWKLAPNLSSQRWITAAAFQSPHGFFCYSLSYGIFL